MRFFDFQKQFSNYSIFSLQDVKKVCQDFSYRQLDRWEKKAYIKKIKRGFYCLTAQEVSQNFLLYTANKIYAPSYVSLEMALKFYGLIPEEIFQTTSVSTKKTASFATSVGNFSYRHIKPDLFWGYRFLNFGKQQILLADPEKAVLDYCYFHSNIKTVDDFREMRLNLDEWKSQINVKKFDKYLESFQSKELSKRIHIFLIHLRNDNT